jgi:hypothetical protein
MRRLESLPLSFEAPAVLVAAMVTLPPAVSWEPALVETIDEWLFTMNSIAYFLILAVGEALFFLISHLPQTLLAFTVNFSDTG